MSLSLIELAPDPRLRGIVRRAVDFDERTARPVRRIEGPMLGIVVLISLGPDIEVGAATTGSFAAGLWDRPVVTGHAGEQRGYQLSLDLLGARRLLGLPLSELANRVVALDDVLGPEAAELTERLAAAPGAAARHAIVQAALRARMRDAGGVVPEVAGALRAIRASHGAVRVERLAADAGWSARHLGERFRAEIGLAPKTVARLARVERAAALLRLGHELADVAYSGGYADQPHFNREFRDLVGCTPGEFRFVQDEVLAA